MTIAVCLCDRGGMLFNNRRQSRDRILIADLIELASGHKFFISNFSLKLFDNYLDRVTVSENPLSEAEKSDFVFVENLALAPMFDKIDKMVIYRWNRAYPADFYLDMPPENNGFELKSTVDFEGSSHEKITKEIWQRKDKQ